MNATQTMNGKGSAMNGTVKINGIELSLVNGRVSWCSAWERIDELVASRHVTRRFYRGCHGHTDYYLA